jgi:hypothetical protein
MVAPGVKDWREESPGRLDRLVAHKEVWFVQHGVQSSQRIGVRGSPVRRPDRIVESERPSSPMQRLGRDAWPANGGSCLHPALYFEDQRVRVAGAEQGVRRRFEHRVMCWSFQTIACPTADKRARLASAACRSKSWRPQRFSVVEFGRGPWFIAISGHAARPPYTARAQRRIQGHCTAKARMALISASFSR